MPIVAGFAAVVLLALAAWSLAGEGRGLEGMKKVVRARFPKVRQLSTAELADWLKDGSRAAPVLLDVRTAAEFNVSHLPGARRVEPEEEAAKVAPLLTPGRPVVMYCSVGYRSSAMAQRLAKAGVTELFNLEGSIFQWANEGRPLERDGKTANKVHPYNGTFGKMLDSQRRAEIPD